MIQTAVNCWAILAAAIANMVLGFLWYGPLFGKTWTGLMGWTEEEMKAGQEKMKKDGWKTYILAFIGSLVMAFVLANSLIFASSYLLIFGMSAGLQAGFWSWVGFIAPVTLGGVLWEGKSWRLWFLLNSYYLVAMLVMGSILALWV